MKAIDLTGQKFSRLLVISPTKLNGSRAYNVKCDCGNTAIVGAYKIKSGHTKSCGCLAIESRSKRRTNLIGQKFSRLLVLEEDSAEFNKDIKYIVKCDCGKTKVVQSSKLKNGHTKSCGCLNIEASKAKRKNLEGTRFGKLVALLQLESYKGVRWQCRCDCGVIKSVSSGALPSGNTTSCGCDKGIANRKRLTTHGQSKTKEYGIAKNASRRAKKLQRRPSWAELLEIREFYKKCPKYYHVDHIVPLQGDLVSGFHVLGNLQYLSGPENLKKGNKFIPYIQKTTSEGRIVSEILQ